MTGVLTIAYHYPPALSAGAARAEGFVRHLPEFGYSPRVLTTSTFGSQETPDVRRACEPLGLYRLLFRGRAPGEPTSSRSQARTQAGAVSRFLAWCKRYLLVPDGQIGWLPHALVVGLEEVRRHDLRLLWSTAPPFSAHLLGMALRSLTGLPWVADFRDTWTYDPIDDAVSSTAARFALEQGLESAVVHGSDRVVAVTEVARDDLSNRFRIAVPKIRLIPNGYDATMVSRDPPGSEPTEGPFHLVHTGSFSYSHVRRTPAPLFQALEGWAEEAPDLPARLCVVLVGALSPEEEEMAARLEPSGLVRRTGPVDRSEALAWQRRAHALLLVDHARPVRAANVPSKCYEYLAAGKPLLALVPDGACRDLVDRLRAGICVPPDDIAGFRRAVDELMAAREGGGLGRWRVKPEAIGSYERRALTAELARCFDEVLGR
jgi:glycosyltransferase involved in cell wall biosynthesis